MRKLEVFFDYSCPYCLRGHEYLSELICEHPDIEISWQPTEAHPEPEHGPHSDKMCQALLYAIDQKADLWAFHKLMYGIVFETHQDREDIDVIACAASPVLSAAGLHKALENPAYAKRAKAINDYAYEKSGVWALPAFRMDGKRLDSVEGVGVSKQQLKQFLASDPA